MDAGKNLIPSDKYCLQTIEKRDSVARTRKDSYACYILYINLDDIALFVDYLLSYLCFMASISRFL